MGRACLVLRKPVEVQEESRPGRCFLLRSSLPPSHNSSIPEMSKVNSPPGRAGVYLINSLKIVKTLLHKIPPHLPLLKGGIIPLFGKEGRGEIFWVMSIQL